MLRWLWTLFVQSRRLVILAIVLLLPVTAQDAVSGEPLAQPNSLWRETWTGVDATTHGWLSYGGATVAPFCQDVWSDGWRLRVAGALGHYRYEGQRWGHAEVVSFHGQVSMGEIMIGYLWRLGALTAKAFAGLAAIDHSIAPYDPLASNGLRFGPKGTVELWVNLEENTWVSADLGVTTAHWTYSARSRLGYRVLPTISLGVEAALNGSAGMTTQNTATDILDPTHRDVRIGSFARYEWYGGEISAAVGLSTDLDTRNDPYATINYIKQF